MAATREQSAAVTDAPSRSRLRLAVLAPRALLVGSAILVCAWVVRRTSWYLAIDQFGYKLPIEFQILGFKPKKWKPEDVLGRMSGVYMSQNFRNEITRARLIAAVGIEKARWLAPVDPPRTGTAMEIILRMAEYLTDVVPARPGRGHRPPRVRPAAARRQPTSVTYGAAVRAAGAAAAHRQPARDLSRGRA